MAAIVQGGLVRVVVPALGERLTINLGIAIAAVSMAALAFAVRPWMIYAIAVPYVLGWGLTGPAVQALVTRAVPAGEQGILQGAISSTRTASGVAASPVSGGLFALFHQRQRTGPHSRYRLSGRRGRVRGRPCRLARAHTRRRLRHRRVLPLRAASGTSQPAVGAIRRWRNPERAARRPNRSTT